VISEAAASARSRLGPRASASAAPRGIVPQPGRRPIRSSTVAQVRQIAVRGRNQKTSSRAPAGDHHEVADAVAAEADVLDQDRAAGLQLTGQGYPEKERSRVVPRDLIEEE
jgi:hypothetical protein